MVSRVNLHFKKPCGYNNLMSKKVPKKSKRSHRIYFLSGILFVVVLVLGFLLVPKSHAPETLSNTQIAKLVNNSTVMVPDFNTTIQLTNGSGVPDAEGSGYIELEEPYLAVKTPTGFDVLTVMNYNLGGSGVFATVALFQIENGQAVFKSSYPVGDRVPVTSIMGPLETSSGNYEVTVDFLSRTDQQPMSDAPTTPAQLHLKISDHKFVINSEN